MTATTTSGFKWLDLLEKEFDKSFVAIDHSTKSVSEEYELEEIYDTQRKLLSNLGHCFVQLVHKAQAIFQVNAKLEAELLNVKEDFASCQKNVSKLETEKSYLLCLLQSCLLENSLLKSKEPSGEDHEKLSEKVQLKLANELATLQRSDTVKTKEFEMKSIDLDNHNQDLKRQVAELESELVGARLDAKYLDKELAGRIQQIQILLASNASQEHKQQVWAQIEAEMHLQRSKTIANMCYSKQRLRDHQITNTVSQQQRKDSSDSQRNGHVKNEIEADVQVGGKLTRNRMKQVHLHKHDADELGMAILGGAEHGLPIIISEIFPNSAVGRSKKIYAGDVILGVNGDSFTEMGHHDAVKYLSALRGSISFDLENTIEADIDEVCDMEARFYQFHIEPETESNETGNSVRGPMNRMALSYPGKAKDVRHTKSPNSPKAPKVLELPKVHSSPNKAKTTDM